MSPAAFGRPGFDASDQVKMRRISRAWRVEDCATLLVGPTAGLIAA
jgi:hypothetical protein